ncbi:MAG TPA: aconitate hydratase AcnA, partial [Candidatus Acidoferrum sp.]|nr:aconitate hydratase AcnA [Candidatus Acidoferrum sp.]
MSVNSFNSRSTLKVGNKEYEIYRLDALDKQGISTKHLPFSLRILLENLLRTEDGRNVKKEDIRALAAWNKTSKPEKEIAFTPSRVLLQDFTGVPCVVDLAAMRDAMKQLGGDPSLINPLQPVELVIDHSVQVDEFGTANAFEMNALLEFQRNKERYSFLRWGQTGFRNLAIVPPDTGIVHQVNLEYLARVVFVHESPGKRVAYPDTLVGTDSHTVMVNGLGVLGWGVGGIEAEAAMLGQAVSMLIPLVVGVKLTGRLREGATATDLVLTVTEMLRKHGVVGKFVEYFGPGLRDLALADRATIGNMAPEYGATCGIFPIDKESLRYLRLTGRSQEQIALVEAYAREQGLFHNDKTPEAEYSELLTLDLASVEPSLAGPKRPQDRVVLSQAAESFSKALPSLIKPKATAATSAASAANNKATTKERWEQEGGSPAAIGVEDPNVHEHVPASVKDSLKHGSVVIAAITSCTNTSNPSVLIGAGLLAKKAVEKGLAVPPWVKTSLAPGSKVVVDYLEKAALMPYLEKLKFHLVGYGCTTCIGNSGPLPAEVSQAIDEKELVVASVLSGNRNFEGRINSEVRANYLMSPPLVVAFALAGRIDIDLRKDPLGNGKDGQPVYLSDLWPTSREVEETIQQSISSEMFTKSYSEVFQGDERWRGLAVPKGETYAWDKDSTYIQRAPYFDDMDVKPAPVEEIKKARVLAVLGDSVTTDHISPAGSIKKDSPAGKYLQEHGVKPADFNSYGSRRGNHEVMVRGTFANVRLRNKLVATEGGFTRHLPTNTEMTIFDASEKYRAEGTPLVILAGKEYGSGSSRDWAAKGPALLGVRAVVAESYERIHRSNLIGMGVLPLQFPAGQNTDSLQLAGEEVFEITGIREVIDHFAAGRTVKVSAKAKGKDPIEFNAVVRIDTPQEALYYANGGILQYVLRQLLA